MSVLSCAPAAAAALKYETPKQPPAMAGIAGTKGITKCRGDEGQTVRRIRKGEAHGCGSSSGGPVMEGKMLQNLLLLLRRLQLSRPPMDSPTCQLPASLEPGTNQTIVAPVCKHMATPGAGACRHGRQR
jgi:hypothetical protein